jgi:DNA-binding transcriptional LysR family regulator
MRQPIDPALLRTFLTVAETESFSRAAVLLDRTQPAMTQQVQKLEALLGCTLLERSRAGVFLTAQGAALAPKIRRLLAIEEEIWAHLEETGVEGDVRLGAPEDIATTYLPGILSQFSETHPKVRLAVTCDFTANLLRAIAEARLDLALIKREPQPGAPDTNVFTERLEWAARRPEDFALRPLPLVLAPAPDVYRKRALEALDTAYIPFREAFVSPYLSGQIAAMHAGLGVAVIPQSLKPAGLAAARDELPVLEPVSIGLVFAKGRNKGPAALLARDVRDVMSRR